MVKYLRIGPIRVHKLDMSTWIRFIWKIIELIYLQETMAMSMNNRIQNLAKKDIKLIFVVNDNI